MGFVSIFAIFLLACLVGGYVARSTVTALHMPMVAGIHAIGGIMIVGALIVSAESSHPIAHYLGLAGVVLATAGIFGGFAVTGRMIAMQRAKDDDG